MGTATWRHFSSCETSASISDQINPLRVKPYLSKRRVLMQCGAHCTDVRVVQTERMGV
jgi:hypothetical protein